jgi:regulator of protease activity HflC (stomatin/prohibitin superfamily)
MRKQLSVGKMVTLGFLAIALVLTLIMSGQMVETVDKGTYQIKQAAISGSMSAKMTPGIWGQYFGDIDVWPKAETWFFTSEKDTADDSDVDSSIEVRFNDGSICNLSGTLRIVMPLSEGQAIALVTERSHKTYIDLQEKLIKPTVRNVLRSTANLMTARESYSERRLDFISMARDQIKHGVYKTREEAKQVEDLTTGEKIWKNVKVIRTDQETGKIMYETNPLRDSGIDLANFEIKQFRYEQKVNVQIAEQQAARMAVETAKANAQKAKQLEQQTVAEGQQLVALAKYEEEQSKIRAVVIARKNKEVQELDANRDKTVAVIAGEKRKAVAQLDKDAAALKKDELILLGQGQAEQKKLVLAADGALSQKLEAYKAVNRYYADAISAYKGNWVPTTVLGGSGQANGANGAQTLINLLTVKTAKDLSLDMGIKKGNEVTD